MCRYRKSIFLCNHSQLSAEPHTICAAQRDYMSGRSAEACDEINTHTRTTLRISKLCDRCGTKKATLDRRLSDVKTKMAELRQHLTEAYGDCVKHVYEAGLEPGVKMEDAKSAGDAGPKKSDPVEEFLRMKRTEEHSHLMMLGSSLRK